MLSGLARLSGLQQSAPPGVDTLQHEHATHPDEFNSTLNYILCFLSITSFLLVPGAWTPPGLKSDTGADLSSEKQEITSVADERER